MGTTAELKVRKDTEKVVELNDNARALLVLDFDLNILRETVDRITIQIHALQKQNGLS